MSWNIDTSHTQVQFTVRHMMISKVRGNFEKFSGTVNLDPDNPASTTVDVQVETASVNTRDEKRDNHLRSPDFFNSQAYPYMTFKSKRVEVLDGSRAHLIGDLTIRDVTREVSLEVEFSGKVKNPWGLTSAGFTGSTRISRKDWGLTWNVVLETGGMLVSDEVEISIELELIQQPEAELIMAA
jgi:polyisoprenoid-binding protein YceI